LLEVVSAGAFARPAVAGESWPSAACPFILADSALPNAPQLAQLALFRALPEGRLLAVVVAEPSDNWQLTTDNWIAEPLKAVPLNTCNGYRRSSSTAKR
jgi:hypothetical protein